MADVRSFVHAGLPDRGMVFGNPMVLEDAAFRGCLGDGLHIEDLTTAALIP